MHYVVQRLLILYCISVLWSGVGGSGERVHEALTFVCSEAGDKITVAQPVG